MASAWLEEEAFACSVCLDTLKEPATLPCGHSYCLACIQRHWDKKATNGEYSCPQCRQLFRPRPSLAKSTLLVEAMEKLRANSLKHNPSAAASMPVYVEVLPDAGPQQARPCPQHRRPLDLFCRDDKECVCSECCRHGHEGHCVVRPQAERAERQEDLLQQQALVQRRIQEAERTLNEIPHFARQHKALVQALQQENADSFAELVASVNLAGTRVAELLSSHEASLGSQAEGRVNGLEQEVAQLHRRSAELIRLADMKDPVCFLKNFLTMEPLGQREGTGESAPPEVVVAAIRSTTKELQESVKDLCGRSLEKITALLNQEPLTGAAAGGADAAGPAQSQSTVSERTPPTPPSPPAPPTPPSPPAPPISTLEKSGASGPPPRAPVQASAPPLPVLKPQRKYYNTQKNPLGGSKEGRPVFGSSAQPTTASANPEPKTREELLKFRFEPTMDPNTAYRHLQLSDGGRRATLKAENLNPPDHPERFHFWRQVLCREPLGGSPYYWEVEWTGPKITVAVAYREMTRKGSDDSSRLGHNALSWSLYWSGTGFSFWHDGQEKLLGSPKARRIGVYLDQHAGVLSFHRIANNQAHLIHRHQSQFSGPLYPGFRFGSAAGGAATICQLD
ncbi:finTRIM family, member 86 isoform X1 [Takifugu flavidus]|uniref:E3 ubiquitin/ISG15 ligase TRIM25 n=1 Tax=Takifugu flavidus TaxID=433684 RepID=A0A5C6PDK9_9TELE|nr:finTRIM family, member 86 isoform X1 [Takifugu flavidus]XP_056905277.1 finTRIM family, member 86 isoform X1 [Takifugu flavidus]TWW76688.1 E3 ubiquitin/ISG15 ligase TRIM25 [Takifugu flavidus]